MLADCIGAKIVDDGSSCGDGEPLNESVAANDWDRNSDRVGEELEDGDGATDVGEADVESGCADIEVLGDDSGPATVGVACGVDDCETLGDGGGAKNVGVVSGDNDGETAGNGGGTGDDCNGISDRDGETLADGGGADNEEDDRGDEEAFGDGGSAFDVGDENGDGDSKTLGASSDAEGSVAVGKSNAETVAVTANDSEDAANRL
jgi:hypothetical protein